MNTPKTDFIFDSAWPRVSDQPRGQHDYLLMVEHARQLETQAQELREALKETLRYADMMHDKSEEGPNNPTAQAIGKAIRKASAILEKTK